MLTHAHETFERYGKETQSLLLLRWKRDQSKECSKEENKEISEEDENVTPQAEKEIDGLSPGESWKTIGIGHGVERMELRSIQWSGHATH